MAIAGTAIAAMSGPEVDTASSATAMSIASVRPTACPGGRVLVCVTRAVSLVAGSARDRQPPGRRGDPPLGRRLGRAAR
jgi:hypothetical protein